MRLYNAICGWLEARAKQMSQPEPERIEVPEGNNFSQVEMGNSMPNEPELHNGWRPDMRIAQPISLRWHP